MRTAMKKFLIFVLFLIMMLNVSCSKETVAPPQEQETPLPQEEPKEIIGIEEIEEALEHMGEAIQDNIRKVDVCTRYSAMQYLIILSHPAEKQIPNIMSRIFMEYYKLQDSQHFTPSYEYISMKQ